MWLNAVWKTDALSLQGNLTMIISIFQPALFENIVNETIQHLHEVVVQHKLGEPEVGLWNWVKLLLYPSLWSSLLKQLLVEKVPLYVNMCYASYILAFTCIW